ncbi:DsbA family protein [Arthrobacter sp. ISL-95]|uniref:DsbA family protein n=1 Tax=Arthrobacter sp. ISL-95 TaxID=2819116 RepID=UPI001BE98FC2|nr:DsbA family protein [Arthrobacter sp. ISL-95]MBT2586510.1 hypothetical protein [Arthrobacter sp. ISL-95]
MDYELRTIPGCPNSGPALELFRQALAAEGRDAGDLLVREVTSEAEAEALNFHGSPSFIVNGQDLFPALSAPALSCRVYASEDTMARLPSTGLLRAAVRGSAAEA